MAEIVPAKPATRVVDNVEIKALPALRSADLADADKLYDEIASCHAVKKRKRSANITKQDLVNASVREHKVLSAAARTANQPPAWFKASMNKALRPIKKQLTAIERTLLRNEVRAFNKDAAKNNRRAMKGPAEGLITMLKNSDGKRPNNGPKTVRDVTRITKNSLKPLAQFYKGANIRCGDRDTMELVRLSFNHFLTNGYKEEEEEGSSDEEEEEEELSEASDSESVKPKNKKPRKQVGKVDDDSC